MNEATEVTTNYKALVAGQVLTQLPVDLYIPPDALEVVLEIFEGPLDLLLYLIRKHNLDILDIPVAEITKQYIQYIELMQVLKIELVAEYLEMAAVLAEIKSRMLLPRPKEEAEEADPRAELVRKLQEYEQIKKATEGLEQLPREGRELFAGSATLPKIEINKPHPEVDMSEVLLAFKDVLKRVELKEAHSVERELLSVRERMSIILSRLQGDKFIDFKSFFNIKEGRLGVVVTFIAVLELVKESILELVQSEPFAPIYVRPIVC